MQRPYRVLIIGHAESHGPDAKAFKSAVGKNLKHLKLGFLDQWRTPAARRHTIARCIYAMGLSDKAHKEAINGRVSKAVQRKIRNPIQRSPLDRARARRRKNRLKRWRRDHRKDAYVTVMYDSVEAHLIPTDAPAVAGYVDGAYENYNELKDRFPHAKHVSIAVRTSSNADVLDIEKGDATPEQAVAWVERQIHNRKSGKFPSLYNTRKPVAYGSVSTIVEVANRLFAANLHEQVDLWSAHVGEGEHICGLETCKYPGLKESVAGTQWLWTHDYDKSKLRPIFF